MITKKYHFKTIPGQYIYKIENIKNIISVKLKLLTTERYFFGLLKKRCIINLELIKVKSVLSEIKDRPFHSLPYSYEYRKSGRIVLYYVPDSEYDVIVIGEFNG